MTTKTPATVVVAGREVRIELPHLNKPSFVSQDNWVAFTDRYQQPDGTYRCELTRQQWLADGREFSDTDLPLAEAVDHITPRSRGGADTADNLQPATNLQNLRKLANDDPSWARPSFFDQSLNHRVLRFSQNLAGYSETRTYDHIWANRRTELSQRDVILLLAWAVRSGKLMGGVVAAFAINHAIIETHGRSSARIRRIAILTHDSATREQYAAELAGYRDAKGKQQPGKWEKLGITERAPRVRALSDTAGADLRNAQLMAQQDIVIMCSQLLWEKNGQFVGGNRAGEVFSQFDLILIDEPHLAGGQAEKIARIATCPVLGTTGTPHDKDLQFNPDRYVLLSMWTKQQSDKHDGSLKYVPDERDPRTGALEATRRPWLTMLDPDTGDALRAGTESTVDLEDLSGHNRQLMPVLAVARKVASICREQESETSTGPADHRGDEWRVGIDYKTHGLVAVDGIETAEQVAADLNAYFSQNRARFPAEDGWQAVAHHGGNGRAKARPLTEASPWLRSDRVLGYGVDAKCARMLVVDQQCREGTSNALCGVVGIAKQVNSALEPGQRIPRGMGAVIDFDQRLCPPAHLDQLRIVTHKCWSSNEAVIGKALDYLLNMQDHLHELTRLDLFMDTAVAVKDEKTAVTRGPLTDQDKTDVVKRVASEVGGNGEVLHDPEESERVREALDEWIKEQYEGSKKKQEQAEQIVDGIISHPDVMPSIILRKDAKVPRLDVLLRENRLEKITLDELVAWVKRRNPGVTVTREMVQGCIDWFKAEYEKDHRVEATSNQQSDLTVNQLARQIASDALRTLRVDHKGKAWTDSNRFAVTGIKQLLGAVGTKLDDKGPYNIPQAHHLIRCNWQTLSAYVRGRLIDALPELDELRRMTQPTELSEETSDEG
jgi:hypothetical protein